MARRHLGRAHVFATAERHDEALTEIEAGLVVEDLWGGTRNSLLLLRRGIETRQGRVDDALQTLEDLVAENVGYPWMPRELALEHIARGSLDDARRVLFDAVRKGVGARGEPLATRVQAVFGPIVEALEDQPHEEWAYGCADEALSTL